MLRTRTQYLRSNPRSRVGRTRSEKISEATVPATNWPDIAAGVGFPQLGNNLQITGFKNTATLQILNSNTLNIQVTCVVTSNAPANRAVNSILCNQAETFISIKPGDYVRFSVYSDNPDTTTITVNNCLGLKTLIDSFAVTVS